MNNVFAYYKEKADASTSPMSYDELLAELHPTALPTIYDVRRKFKLLEDIRCSFESGKIDKEDCSLLLSELSKYNVARVYKNVKWGNIERPNYKVALSIESAKEILFFVALYDPNSDELRVSDEIKCWKVDSGEDSWFFDERWQYEV